MSTAPDAVALNPKEEDVSIDLRFDPDVDPELDMTELPVINADAELAMCQICFEFFGTQDIVRNICGPKCLAEVCAPCLVQHLTATVYAFYPGVLPKVRCPVCMTLLNKAQWSKFVAAPTTNEEEEDDEAWRLDYSFVLDKYALLCRQSCGFQSPCCHDTEYTMLPAVVRASATSFSIKLPCQQAALVPELQRQYQRFCRHRIAPSEFYDFMQQTFEANAETVFKLVLLRVADEERRAALLLYHLFLKPNTYTLCCEHPVCFKCKAANHHDGRCNDFIEDESVLDCPGCHVTLVKVDGCDSVTCLCGYSIEWPIEMEKQRLQRKLLAPKDGKTYQNWRVWAQRLDLSLDKIEALETTWQAIRLQRVVQRHKDVLQRFVRQAVRRARLHLVVTQYRDPLRKLVYKRFPRLREQQENDMQYPCSEIRSAECSMTMAPTPHFAAAA